MSNEKRLDVLLVERGLISGRDRAKELISKGLVLADGALAKKPSAQYSPEVQLEITGQEAHYVSRAAAKLLGALDAFSISLTGKTVLDVGASTGGFTQCALERGAKQVYAVDVGRDQLAPVLRADPRVLDLQQTDIRLLSERKLPEKPDFAVCDVSFISLRLVLPHIRRLLAENGQAVVLIKPQFEAGRSAVGRGGLVKDPRDHLRVLEEVLEQFRFCNFQLAGLMPSPIRGGDGNAEYLAWLRIGGTEAHFDLPALVRKALQAKGKEVQLP